MSSKINLIETIEDNAGGLHLACFSEGKCIAIFSGFEAGSSDAPSMREEVEAAIAHGVRSWDGCADEPQEAYDDLTSTAYGWKLIGEHRDGAYVEYPNVMGSAGARWAKAMTVDEDA